MRWGGADGRIFLAGLALRIVLLALVVPVAHIEVTMPLMLGVLPAMGGSIGAGGFAGGLPDLILIAPLVGLGDLIGAPLLMLKLTILGLDVVAYLQLRRLAGEERRDEVLALFWLSPLSIVLTYWTGALAGVALMALLGGFVLLQRRRYRAAGVAFGMAVASCPALLLLAPLIALFGASLRRIRPGAVSLLGALAITIGAFLLAPMLAPGFREMVLASPAVVGLIALQLPIGGGVGIALLPLVIATLLYATWRVRLLTDHLLFALVGVGLMAIIALAGAPPAVACIAIPFAATHAAYAERSGRALLVAFSAAVIAWHGTFGPGGIAPGGWSPTMPDLIDGDSVLPTVLMTAVAISALVFGVQALARGVLRSTAFRAARRTIAIGVAGDSGAGKDTLADGLAGLFGPRLVTGISGDDYHLWDRNKPMWRAMTHLNPQANDLALFGRNVQALIDRRWVRARHYDHRDGRMTKPLLVPAGEIIIASGLHALLSPSLNAQFDLRLYLDMDEDLRRFLKINRDVHVRGHPIERVIASIERRYGDAVSYVHPQRDHADLVIRLEPRDRNVLAHAPRIDRVGLRLVVEARAGISMEGVTRELVSIAGMQAILLPRASGASRLIVEGEPDTHDVATIAHRLAPEVCELLASAPAWEPGLKGVMQLVMLDQLEQIRHHRSAPQ